MNDPKATRVCPECKMISGKEYDIESIPALPYEKCTS